MPADRLFHPRLGHSQKVSSLSHLEARVWQTYILAADDFGVMQYSPLVIQGANDALAREPIEVIQQALDRLVSLGLVAAFTHQHNRYVFQEDWQDWQKVEYPRVSIQPRPPKEALAECSVKTRKLFARHPGGSPKGSPKVSRKFSEESPSNARARARETANGKRLTAHGSRGESEGRTLEHFTREELAHARRARATVHLGCPHDPRCAAAEACVRLLAAEYRRAAS